MRDTTTLPGCEAALRDLYGVDGGFESGVLHVTAVWRDPSGQLRTLALGDAAPRSTTDAFVLATARARADAILTTGQILRDEPDLQHVLSPGPAAWRRERLGKRDAPWSVVLTRRADLDLAHPLFVSSARKLVVTSKRVAAELAARVADAVRAEREEGGKIEVVGRPHPGLRDTLALLRERGCETIAVEVGPATNPALYEAPAAVDELLLSVYLVDPSGDAEAPPVCGAPLFGDAPGEVQLDALFPLGASYRTAYESHEESGAWSFRRYRRVASPS